MLTVRQHNALVALNQALQAASDCGLFDIINATPSVINQFCEEMQYSEEHDSTAISDALKKEHDDFLTRVANRLAE